MDSLKTVHPLETKQGDSVKLPSFFLVLFVVIIVGGAFGFLISSAMRKSSSSTSSTQTGSVEKSAGIVDKKTFKDTATGILREGGIDGEGNFHLERPGGESQNAYLTSSTVDLTPYIGKKVQVWGQTFTGQKAGWLMDVGLIQVLQ